MAIGDLRLGGVAYKTVRVGGNVYYIGDSVITIDDIVNDAIIGLDDLSIEWDENNEDDIIITFDPITDTKILDAVETGQTIVRLQLLNHSPSYSIGWKIDNNCYCKRPFEFDADAFPSAHDDLVKRFVRTRSNNGSYNGRTWVNLTRTQLIQGSAKLQNVKNTAHFLCENECPDEETGETCTYRLAVEMYCPCLHKSGKDVWYYERNGKYKVSNILTYIDWENQQQ